MQATLPMPSAAVSPTLITELGTTALAELSDKKTVLAAMRAEFTGLSCDTKDGYEATHKAIQRLVKVRTSTEKRAAELKTGARKWIDDVNATAKEIIGIAEEIETPLRAMRDAVDEAAERERQAKIDAERERLAAIERQRLADEAAKIKAEQDRRDEELRIAEEKNRIEREKIEAFRAEMAAQQKKLDDAKAAQEAEAAAAKAKADAEAKAERDRIEADAQAARDKIEAERRAEENRQRQARDKLEAEKRAFQAKQEAAERAERDRLQAIEDARIAEERAKAAKEQAELEAKKAAELAELERIEAEQRAAAEAERLEALKPDREKLAKWAAKMAKAIDTPLIMSTEEGADVRDNAIRRFSETVEYLRNFAEK